MMGFITGVSFIYAWQRWVKLCRQNRWTKMSHKPVTASKPKAAAAYAPSNVMGAYETHPAPTNKYSTLHNEVSNGEYLTSTAVNESFDLEALRRTDHESFHSLSCIPNKDGR